MTWADSVTTTAVVVVHAGDDNARAVWPRTEIGARGMRLLEELLIRISNDPVKYALRVVFILGVLLLVLLAVPKA
jgi:hypothetical protein